MLTKLKSASISGISVQPVELEMDAAPGLPAWEIVGLPDTAVRESKERVRTAIRNAGYEFPARKIIVNLAPAHFKKEGAALDLALAVALLSVTGQVNPAHLIDYLFLAELGLDGTLRPVKGVLPISGFMRESNLCMIVAEENKKESAIGGCTTYGFRTLREVVDFLNGKPSTEPCVLSAEELFRDALLQENCSHNMLSNQPGTEPDEVTISNVTNISIAQSTNTGSQKHDFRAIKGQTEAKRALEIAAAGNHNILMIGSPGSGKTMLAEALPGILPTMTPAESLEISTLYSIAGLLPGDTPLLTRRPIRSPHHSISMVSMTGGGKYPRPGEISLAHHGVLFLDELPEFRREALEALRQPLEDGTITISRLQASLTFPCRFLLVAAMNPCPCGYANDPGRQCSCTPAQIHRYRSRLSGPLLDRFDLQIEILPVTFQELYQEETEESSRTIAQRVSEARLAQQERFVSSATIHNSMMTQDELLRFCALDSSSRDFLETAFHSLKLSARAHNRVLKVARTIADLDHASSIQVKHLAEAIQYRTTDRNNWMNPNGLPF